MSLSKHSNDSNDSCTPASCCSGIEGMWKSYLHQLVVNPVRTKALTSCFAASLATVVAQLSVGVPIGNINWTAVKNQAIIGMELLTRIFASLGYRTPASQGSTVVVAGKMALDQLAFAPLHMLYYMYAIGFLEGRTTAETSVKVAAEFWPIMQANWRVWPIVSFLNFKLVPPQLRVLTLNCVGVAWMVFVIKKLSAAAAAAAAVKK